MSVETEELLFTQPSTSLSQQLESMAAASRTIETAFSREKAYSAQLKKYATDLAERIQKSEARERMTAQEREACRSELENLKQALQETSQELGKTRESLERYRGAWSEVLRREKKAEEALGRTHEFEERVRQAEAKVQAAELKFRTEKQNREKSEQHVELHRNELQSLMVRLHTSEARYNDMMKELEALQMIRKTQQLEITKAQDAARMEAEAKALFKQNELAAEVDRERARGDHLFLELEQLKEKLAQTDNWKSEAEGLRDQLEEMESEFRAEIGGIEEKFRAECRRALDELAQEREARIAAERAKTRVEKELEAKDQRISALRSECVIAQEILIAEKTRLGDLGARLTELVSGLENAEERESWMTIARLLRESAEVRVLDTEPVSAFHQPVGSA